MQFVKPTVTITRRCTSSRFSTALTIHSARLNLAALAGASVPVARVGTTGGDGVAGVTLDRLRAAHEGFFPRLMGADAALA